MLDTTIGRWVSEDPIGFEAADANLYRNVGNNPTNFVDPTGLQQEIPAPTIQPQTIEQIAKALLDTYRDNAGANEELRERGILNYFKKSAYFTIEDLKTPALQKVGSVGILNAAETVDELGNKLKIVLGTFISAQTATIPNYNGSVIQVIRKSQRVITTKDEVVMTTLHQVEGFTFKNGKQQNLDIHTTNIGFKLDDLKSVHIVYEFEIGAGLYNGKTVQGQFQLLEKIHPGPVEGKVTWTGKTTTYRYHVKFDAADLKNREHKGYFSELNKK